jgi:hypothetical protein
MVIELLGVANAVGAVVALAMCLPEMAVLGSGVALLCLICAPDDEDIS